MTEKSPRIPKKSATYIHRRIPYEKSVYDGSEPIEEEA